MITSDKDKFLLNFEGQDFSVEAKTFLKVRESASQHLSTVDFPTVKDEDWKYTKIKPILNEYFVPQTSINNLNIDKHRIPGWEGHTLVFINGFFAPKLSNIQLDKEAEKGFFLKTIQEAKADNAQLIEQYYSRIARYDAEAFTALNAAYANNGLFLYLDKNIQLQKPVNVIFLNEGDNVSAQPRNLIIAEKGASAHVVFTYQSIDDSLTFTNSVLEVVAKDNTNVTIDKIQLESEKTFHIGREEVLQERDSTVTFNTFTLGGKLVRNDITAYLEGPNTETNMNGLYITTGDQHVDNHTRVNHNQPGSVSNENYKGIVGGRSTAVFNGKVYVHKKAQQTNAFQSNDNVLMTDEATVNSKPELEIYADDVKCSHGSTIGQFDEEAVFFLRARGIGEEKAKEMMVKAFSEEVIDALKIESVKTWVEGYIERQLTKVQDV
jgi:Fe-S cluster assembly protein SufD